jgi:hypothetical protein
MVTMIRRSMMLMKGIEFQIMIPSLAGTQFASSAPYCFLSLITRLPTRVAKSIYHPTDTLKIFVNTGHVIALTNLVMAEN